MSEGATINLGVVAEKDGIRTLRFFQQVGMHERSDAERALRLNLSAMIDKMPNARFHGLRFFEEPHVWGPKHDPILFFELDYA